VSLDLKEAVVPWSSPGQFKYLMGLYASIPCHITVPSEGAISTSDIKGPLSAFLPVWCHRDE